MDMLHQPLITLAQVIDIGPLPNSKGGDPANGAVQTVFLIVMGVLGAVSLLMIVIGGVRYILSEGNPEAMSKAKGTIIYALVGLVIAMTAYGIISLVVKGVA